MMFLLMSFSPENGLRLTFRPTLGKLRVITRTPQEIGSLLSNHDEMCGVLKGCRDALNDIPEGQRLGDSAINRQIMRAERVIEGYRKLMERDT